MGLVFDQVSFDGRAPDIQSIADKITALCGLAVIVDRSDADVMANLYDQHAHVAFACAAEERLEMFSYRPGAVRQFYDEFTDGVELPIDRFVTGLHEPAGTQTVYLRGFVGLETLMGVTVLALEALGGRPRQPISDDIRREYGTPITEAELLERRRKLVRQLRQTWLILVLLLPVTIPLFVIGLLARLVTMPWRIRKAMRLATDAISKQDHDKLLRSNRAGS